MSGNKKNVKSLSFDIERKFFTLWCRCRILLGPCGDFGWILWYWIWCWNDQNHVFWASFEKSNLKIIKTHVAKASFHNSNLKMTVATWSTLVLRILTLKLSKIVFSEQLLRSLTSKILTKSTQRHPFCYSLHFTSFISIIGNI